jgi:glycine dehydrogenase
MGASWNNTTLLIYGYGGPHAAYLLPKKITSVLCQEDYGVSQDADGNRALRMALQTREQHIKREKLHLTFVQLKCYYQLWQECLPFIMEKGLRYIAEKVHSSAGTLANV